MNLQDSLCDTIEQLLDMREQLPEEAKALLADAAVKICVYEMMNDGPRDPARNIYENVWQIYGNTHNIIQPYPHHSPPDS